VVDLMLPKMSNVNRVFPDGNTCLAAAAKGNQVTIAKQLLDMGADVNLPVGRKVLTPLHIAAGEGHANMVAVLLSAGASTQAQSDSKSTPFYRAARSGNIEAIKLLLEKGSDINAR
ncbi:ankyrin, partial [Cadophora sp. DSE1049]